MFIVCKAKSHPANAVAPEAESEHPTLKDAQERAERRCRQAGVAFHVFALVGLVEPIGRPTRWVPNEEISWELDDDDEPTPAPWLA